MAKSKDQQQREIREITLQATNHYNFHAPDSYGVWKDEWRKKIKAEKIRSLEVRKEGAQMMSGMFRVIADNIRAKDGKIANKAIVTWLLKLGVTQVTYDKSHAGIPEIKVYSDYRDYYMLPLCPCPPTIKPIEQQPKIDAEYVISKCEKFIGILDKRIIADQDCIDNYDKYYQMGIDMLDIIDRYNDLVPYEMRFNQSGRFELLT